jgi:hypothetical protein
MEELKPEYFGKDSTIGTFCAEMYHKTADKNPVTGLFNGVRIVMFTEE